MSSLVITRGLPGAGKTTWARAFAQQHGYVRVNRDDTRMMLFGKKTGLTFEQEKAVTDTVQAAVRAHLKEGRSVVADDMNLRSKYVREWEKLAKSCFAEFNTAEFNISVEEAIERQHHRPEQDRVPADVIRSLATKYTPSGIVMPVHESASGVDKTTWLPYEDPADEGAPLAIIVDIDGTVAKNMGRGWYDLDRVGEDGVFEHIVDLVRTYSFHWWGLVVLFTSGRSEDAREVTDKWLRDNVVDEDMDWKLIMRPSGDNRPDSQVKYELFDQHIRGKYRVLFALDDRNQVVEMWREIGIPCLQVAPGDF